MLNGDSNENGKNKNNRSKGTIKRAAKKRAICFATFMQNQLNNVRCCALYHSRQKNLVTLFVAKQVRTSVEKRAASYRYSLTRSAAMYRASRVSFDLPRFYLGRSKETLLAG